jgi:hypothetical protein
MAAYFAIQSIYLSSFGDALQQRIMIGVVDDWQNVSLIVNSVIAKQTLVERHGVVLATSGNVQYF